MYLSITERPFLSASIINTEKPTILKPNVEYEDYTDLIPEQETELK